MAKSEIRPLTGIRGVAALWVVAFHLGFASSRLVPHAAYWGLWWGVRSGYLAVDLFFLLSGFVLAMVHWQDADLSWRRSSAFFLERGFRVMPLNVVALLLLLALVAPLRGTWLNTDPHSLRIFLACLLLVQEWTNYPRGWNTPGWSLSSEVTVYLVFPVAAALVARWKIFASVSPPSSCY